MLSLRLPKDLADRLEAMAEKTGKTKHALAREAIIEKLPDIEAALSERPETSGKAD